MIVNVLYLKSQYSYTRADINISALGLCSDVERLESIDKSR